MISERANSAEFADLSYRLFSIDQVGDTLGLRKSAVYELMTTGALAFVRISARHRMVKAADLQDFINGRRTGGWNQR